jgi:probable addiction module antidote protein
MPKRTIDYHSWRLGKLADPKTAASYLNAAMDDSPEMFLKAVMNVTQAQRVARIAKRAGIKRESIYRAFSKEGNPTLDTLHSVLGALGITMEFAAKPTPLSEPKSRSARHGHKQPRKIRVSRDSVERAEYKEYEGREGLKKLADGVKARGRKRLAQNASAQ